MDSREGLIFCQDDFLHQSFSAFDDMREKEEFVDFKITSGNRCIRGHRVILAARIPYFRTLFLSSEEEVFLSEIGPDALESVIDFAYSGRIKITPGNVRSLLSASKALQLTQVYEACWEFVTKILHSSNVLDFRKFAQDHRCPKYLDLIDNYIIQNFEEFAKSESLLVFPFQKLKEVISRDDIKVSTEENVFEAAIRWVKGSLSERKDLLPELLSAVRMYFLKPEFLIERVSNDKLVMLSKVCRDLVDEAKSYHFLPDKRPQFCRLPPEPRIYQKYYSMVPSNPPLRNLYAVCYFGLGVSVKMLNHNNHIWCDVSKFTISQVDAVVELTGMIYIFGNSNISTFDLKTLDWNIVKNPGNMDVSCSGVVTCNNRIYFFGGLGNESRRVRFFDPAQKLWFVDGYMSRYLQNSGATSLGEFIYVTGGMFGGKTSRVVELFNSQRRKWTELPPMNFGRYDHGCCCLNGKVYVCGGFSSEEKILSSVEVYHPKTNQWIKISAMNEPTYKLSVVSNSGRICSMGRTDKYSLRAANMQVYDPSDNEWNDDVAIPGIRNYTVYLVRSEAK